MRMRGDKFSCTPLMFAVVHSFPLDKQSSVEFFISLEYLKYEQLSVELFIHLEYPKKSQQSHFCLIICNKFVVTYHLRILLSYSFISLSPLHNIFLFRVTRRLCLVISDIVIMLQMIYINICYQTVLFEQVHLNLYDLFVFDQSEPEVDRGII